MDANSAPRHKRTHAQGTLALPGLRFEGLIRALLIVRFGGAFGAIPGG
jgi:hypothetical protein